MEATGTTGTIELAGDLVTIRRRSFLGEGVQVRSIKLADVTVLDYRPATAIGSGFIRLLVTGSTPSLSSAHDPNGVAFQIEDQDQFLLAYQAIYEAKYGHPPKDIAQPTVPVWAMVVALVLVVLFMIYIWLPVVTSAV